MHQKVKLLIDKGNSFCKLALVRQGQISPIEAYKHLSTEVLSDILMGYTPENISAIYSGVGAVETSCLSLLQEKVGYLLVLDQETRLPLKDIYYERAKIGSDRLALAVGALHLYPNKNVLIVDIGTAITYDFINSEGIFIGGDITAGPKTRIRGLHLSTAHLPDIPILKHSSESLFGNTTEEAISNGITRGIVAEINSYIDLVKKKYMETIIILTGGYTPFFANRIKFRTFVIPNLLMVGLNEILEYNE